MAERIEVLRTEKKYGLSYLQAERLFCKMSRVLPGDPINGIKPYMVRSLYFDSFDDRDYYGKEAGDYIRRKIRLRIYGTEAEEAKLELKMKEGEQQRKRSLIISRQEAEQAIEGRYGFLMNKNDEFAKSLYGMMNEYLYRPVCTIQYERRAFVAPANNTRITFDVNISSNEGDFDLFNSKLFLCPVTSPLQTILEVKYNGFLLSYIKDVLSLQDLTQISASKYMMSRYYGLNR